MSTVSDYARHDLSGRNEHRPLVELLLLAGPTVAQMASYTVMQFIDTWILSRISDQAATAASNSGIFAFSAIGFGMGTLMVVNTLVSQNFGQRNDRACGRCLWQGIWFGAILAVLLLPVVPVVERAFLAFGHSAQLLALEKVYLRIVILSAVLKFASTALGQFMLGINRPNAVLGSAVIGTIVNAAVAVLLVLRLKMGIAGAAWAQNIGVAAEMLALVGFVLRKDIRRAFHLAGWQLRWREFWTLLRVGIPSGVQFVVDVLAWGLFAAWVLAIFGDAAMAANTYMFRYMSVSFMPAVGVGNAVTSLVGRYIGAGRPDIAARRAHLGFVLTFAYMLVMGLIFVLARNPMMSWFTRDPEVLRLGATLLIIAAFYELFDAMYIVYVGALRGAGDTLVPAIVIGVLNWGLSLGGGYAIARLLPQWGIFGPWSAATAYGVSLGVFMFIRFQAGGWKKINLVQRHRSPETPASAKVPGQQLAT
jgi:multidrug resistance protein, MATE family